MEGGKTMEKFIFHQMVDNTYMGIISVIDYEISVKKCLSEIQFPSVRNSKRKIMVDMALKCGINQYRFVAFDVSDEGKILWYSSEYVVPNSEIVSLADAFLKERGDIVTNSMLPNVKKRELLNI